MIKFIRQILLYFIRFWPCQIHCPPFLCFCKPSPYIYTTGLKPLKLENTPHLPSEVQSVLGPSASIVGTVEFKQNIRDDKEKEAEHGLKSILRKPSFRRGSPKEERKKVQWTDSLGEELAEIKEYEPSEDEDTDEEDDDNNYCLCTIL